MTKSKRYRCVNCGEAAGALFRTYGPSVLKLTKCEQCKQVVDKYIEYDPVIVMIDLVLMSKEAQRHVLYNTDFKAYWKLLIVLTLLETYGVWRSDSLFSMAVHAACGITTHHTQNNTHLGSLLPAWRAAECRGWRAGGRDDDLFIWEKDFYIQFLSTTAGIVVFILTVHCIMTTMKAVTRQHTVSLRVAVQGFSLANTSLVLTLPTLVWGGAPDAPETRALHYALVYIYTVVVFTHLITVVYSCGVPAASLVVACGACAKAAAMFHATPRLRDAVK